MDAPKRNLSPTTTIDRWFTSGRHIMLAWNPLTRIFDFSLDCFITNSQSVPVSKSLIRVSIAPARASW
jgi:hypothetical protein